MTALLLLLACQDVGSGAGSDAVAMRKKGEGIIVVAPGYQARAEAAWDATEAAQITGRGKDLLEKVGTTIAVDVPARLTGLPAGLGTIDLRADAAIKQALFGNDEAAAADLIRKAGAKALVVHTDIRPSFDRDGRVLSRLYHHDGLDRFQLARVEDNALVYLVVDAPLQLPPELAQTAIAWLRAELSGKRPAPFPPMKPERSDWNLVTVLRGRGHELAVSLARADTLDVALREAARDLEIMYRRQREVLGFPRLDAAMSGLRIELHRIKEMADVVPRGEPELEQLWELGIDGAIFRDKEKKKAGMWPGDTAATRGLTTADEFLRALAKDFKWDSHRPWREPEHTDLQLIRTQHYIEMPNGSVAPLYRGTAPVPIQAVTLDTVRSAIVYSGEWYLQNLKPDGAVTYKFWPEELRWSNEDNHVRHELATWNLVQAWHVEPRPEFLEGAARAQDWTLKFLTRRDGTNLETWEQPLVERSPYRDAILKDGMAYFTYANVNKLGSNVVGLMGMIDLARATGRHDDDALMRQLGRFVQFSMNDDGTFRPYHVPPGHPYEHEKNDIVPGEAALALVMLSEYFQDPSYTDGLQKFFNHYKGWYKERAERKNLKGPWPAFTYNNDDRLDLVQFGPWTVMAADAYTRVHPEATDVVDFGLEVGRWMIETYAYTAERAPFPDYVGGYYKFEGELPAMQAFCYGEGTAAAYAMSLRTGRKEEARYFEKATRETVRFGIQTQHDGLDTYAFARPELVQGGIKYALNEPKVRIDYVYHGQSTMWQWLQAAQHDPDLPAEVKAPLDEKLRNWLASQDMPLGRPAGAPVRTSVPRDGEPALVAPPADSTSERDDGGGE